MSSQLDSDYQLKVALGKPKKSSKITQFFSDSIKENVRNAENDNYCLRFALSIFSCKQVKTQSANFN